MKFSQEQVDGEVKTLLALKADYKSCTGKDWKPGAHQPAASPAPSGGASAGDGDELNEKITDQGNKVRQLKGDKAAKVRFYSILSLFFFFLTI